jgi:hypothetical protein
MNAAEMPSTQDAAIAEALGWPLAVLYSRAAAGTVEPRAQRVLELRSFLAVVEDQAGKARDRIHHATGPQGDLYRLSPQDLRFHASLLEAAQAAGRLYDQMLRELLPEMPAPNAAQHRAVQFTPSKIAAISPREGGLAARPGQVGGPAAGVDAGRHRR